MRHIFKPHRFVAAAALAALLLASSGASAVDATRTRIVVIGDSTAASYPKPPKDRPDLTGWGQVFGQFFRDDVEVVNHARSGRSSKSFRKEGHWRTVLSSKPDYVFIQFGHNDCPGKGDRSTDPETDFRDYLRRYVDEAKKANVIVVLVTPMTRRNFNNGKIRTILRPYADATIAVAKQKGVGVIDLHAASVMRFNELGDQGSADWSASPSDRTHFSRKGATAIARMIVERIPQAEPQLKPLLRNASP